MASLAVETMRAGISIVDNLVVGIPCRALMILIWIEIRLPSIILPVVCVNARFPIMILFLIWTPLSLKVEHEEVLITIESFYQVYGDLRFIVRKGTKVPILASLRWVREALTELGFVHLGMIKFFYRIMSKVT